MADLFPNLKGLKGGEKQHWINANLDFILSLNDALGFEKTCQVLYMKADTLVSALERQEKYHRPAITHADKAYLMAQRANTKADATLKELAVHADVITRQISEVGELKENLTSYFTLMEKANGLMARLCQATTANLTEHIDSPNKRKVGPTRRTSRGRLLLSVDRGKKQLPRPLKKPQHRSSLKRRRYDA